MNPYRRRILLSGIFPLLGGPFYCMATTSNTPIFIVTTAETATTQQLLQKLKTYHNSVYIINQANLSTQKASDGIYIAIGSAPLEHLLSTDTKLPIISLFIARPLYHSITDPFKNRSLTAIYAETSPKSLFKLIKLLYGRRVLVGCLLGESTWFLHETIKQAAASEDLTVDIVGFARNANPAEALHKLHQANVILAVPDDEVYSANNLRPLLETAYRREQAIVGFHSGMVRAGALATTYASVEDIIPQINGVIAAMISGSTPLPAYPLYWRSVINDSVASSLNIVISEGARNLSTSSK